MQRCSDMSTISSMNDWPKIIQVLIKTGLSQAKIAKACAMSRGGLHNILSGLTQAPSGDSAVLMADLYRTRCSRPLPQKKQPA